MAQKIMFTASDLDLENIAKIAERNPPPFADGRQDVISIALDAVANGIVFRPNESEQGAIDYLLNRNRGLQGEEVRAIGWALAAAVEGVLDEQP